MESKMINFSKDLSFLIVICELQVDKDYETIR